MSEQTLFEMPEPAGERALPRTRPEEARVVRAVRNQAQWQVVDLDGLLATDHPARAIWAMLERMDLSAFYGSVKAVVDGPGRPGADPQVLLGLWLLATSQGVGSARQVARLCTEHDAYRWMCGGVAVNYHLLADFRVAHQAELNDLLSQILAVLSHAGLVQVERIAQDGVRVRADAGEESFRGRASLEEHLGLARAQVERLLREREHPDPGQHARVRRAQERAARERVERLEQAIAALPKLQAIKERTAARRGKGTPVKGARASSTDPEARVMRMADGSFHPAYNVQVASAVGSRIVVGVSVTDTGADAGQAIPMARQVESRTGVRPTSHLFDAGFVHRGDITTLERQGTTVYAPLRPTRRRDGTRAPLRPYAGDTPEIAAWHARQSTPEGRAIYRQRATTAEWVNAQLRERHNLRRFTVRGIAKVTCVVLLAAITHDLLRWIALAPA